MNNIFSLFLKQTVLNGDLSKSTTILFVTKSS